jgi:hypothetical protein
MITRDEMYEFDLRGFIICRGVLSPREVQHCISVIGNRRFAARNGKFSFFELDRFFMELMARPRTIGILKQMVGEWRRFDHAFGMEMTKSEPISENLHAGLLQNQRAFYGPRIGRGAC